MNVSVLLLHTNDVGRMVRFALVNFALVEGKEAKLEEVLDHNGDLEERQELKLGQW